MFRGPGSSRPVIFLTHSCQCVQRSQLFYLCLLLRTTCERLQGSGPQGSPGCLVLGDLGGRRVAQSVRTMVEVVGCGSGLVGWHIKGVLLGELFTLCRNCLTLGGAVHPGSASPQVSKHQKMQKTKNKINTHLLLLSIPFSSFEARPDSTSLEKAVVREGLSSDLFPRTQHKL